MRIIIAGDGETGTHLAGMLSVENQNIVLMGTDRDHLSELDAVSNFITFEGSPLSMSNLSQCGAESADLFVAVTPDETVNIVACEMARACGASRCVARVDNPEFDTDTVREMMKSHGVDMIIYPEKLAAVEIGQFIEHNWVSEWFQLHNGSLYIVGVRMHDSGSMCGKYLRDVPNSPRLFHVSAIRRRNEIIIPRGDDRIMSGDTVYFSVLPQNVMILPEICGNSVSRVRHIMISGAGHVTENLLELIGSRYAVTVIDPDRERCAVMARRFPNAVVVNSTVNDVATLRDEGLDKCDMFLALTGSSETNIVSCMVAREHGVGKVVARIEELQYIPEAESLSIDKIINKKLLNAGRILNVLLDSNVTAIQCMSIDQAEITEIVAPAGSRIVAKPVNELSLPRGITVGGLIRDGQGMLVEGRTCIRPGDHVVLFCVSGMISDIERLFR